MGVCRVVHSKGPSAATINHVHARILSLFDGAKRVRWESTITSHLGVPSSSAGAPPSQVRGGTQQERQRMYTLLFSDIPNDVFLLAEKRGHTNVVTSVLQADTNMLSVLGKTRRYSEKAVVRIEGFVYDLGDFFVRVGAVSSGGQSRGCLLEVEYCPCLSIGEDEIVEEFFQLLLEADNADASIANNEPLFELSTLQGDGAELESVFMAAHLPAQYERRHTAVQYLRVLSQQKVV